MNELHPTRDEIVDHLHGELAHARDAALTAHLAACATCAQARDAELAVTAALRAHAAACRREMPLGLAAAIRSAAGSERRGWRWWPALLRPLTAVPAAAAIVLAVWVAVHLRTPTPERIDAAYYVRSHAELSAIAPFSEYAPLPPNLESDDAPR